MPQTAVAVPTSIRQAVHTASAIGGSREQPEMIRHPAAALVRSCPIGPAASASWPCHAPTGDSALTVGHTVPFYPGSFRQVA